MKNPDIFYLAVIAMRAAQMRIMQTPAHSVARNNAYHEARQREAIVDKMLREHNADLIAAGKYEPDEGI